MNTVQRKFSWKMSKDIFLIMPEVVNPSSLIRIWNVMPDRVVDKESMEALTKCIGTMLEGDKNVGK